MRFAFLMVGGRGGGRPVRERARGRRRALGVLILKARKNPKLYPRGWGLGRALLRLFVRLQGSACDVIVGMITSARYDGDGAFG